MTTVSLEAAKALKAAGMEQGKFPQMVWLASAIESDDHYPKLEHWKVNLLTGRRPAAEITPGASWAIEWYAAPDPLTALMWLETAKGWHWKREYNSHWKECSGPEPEPDWQATWEGDADWGDREFDHSFWTEKADTPDSLVIQICGRLVAMGAGTAAAMGE